MEITISTQDLPLLLDAVNNALIAYCALTGNSEDKSLHLFDTMTPETSNAELNELKQLYLQLNKYMGNPD